MPCRASAARCRVQVTSNVRLPRREETQIPKTRANGRKVQVQVVFRESSANRAIEPGTWEPKGARSAANFFDPLTEWPCKHQSKTSGKVVDALGRLKMVRAGSSRDRSTARNPCASGVALYRKGPPRGSIRCMAILRIRPSRKPNPSVNLTRNSVPHLPGSARYAHNALPGKRVTLPHAGYLKR
jgi:hypothetical protein